MGSLFILYLSFKTPAVDEPDFLHFRYELTCFWCCDIAYFTSFFSSIPHSISSLATILRHSAAMFIFPMLTSEDWCRENIFAWRLGRQSKVTDKWRTQRNRWRLKKETLRAFKIWLDLYHSIFNMYNHSVTLYWAPMCCYFYLQTGFSRWYIRLLNNLRRYLDVRLLRQHFLLI